MPLGPSERPHADRSLRRRTRSGTAKESRCDGDDRSGSLRPSSLEIGDDGLQELDGIVDLTGHAIDRPSSCYLSSTILRVSTKSPATSR